MDGAALCSANRRASGHRPGIVQEDRVRIAGAKPHGQPAGTGGPAGTAGLPPPDASARRVAGGRRMWIILGLVATLLAGVTAAATYAFVSHRSASAGASLRPS